ncbi:MAG: hypothetical protein AAGA70_08630 [Pseudomonadota bacterium]
MELRFVYAFDRQFYAMQFKPGPHETVPFVRELRFWGVDRQPCTSLSTMAALIALKHHPMAQLTLNGIAMNAPVCSALQQHFGVEIHPARYEADRRELLGGEKTVAPIRFAHGRDQAWPGGGEVLNWISLDDLHGPLSGNVRTNIDAFDLSESEKNLIVALCCAGKHIGHIMLAGGTPGLAQLLHRLGLELIDGPTEALTEIG